MTAQAIGGMVLGAATRAMSDPEVRTHVSNAAYAGSLQTAATVSGVLAGGLEGVARGLRKQERQLNERARQARENGYSSSHLQETLGVIRDCWRP